MMLLVKKKKKKESSNPQNDKYVWMLFIKDKLRKDR